VVGCSLNRRRHERFSLPPMYTSLTVNVMSEPKIQCEGHCYDISEGGVQFELDDAIPRGTPVQLLIELPSSLVDEDECGERAVAVIANVVWIDSSEPGPVRMAAVFSRFARADDRERLFRHITSGRLVRAA